MNTLWIYVDTSKEVSDASSLPTRHNDEPGVDEPFQDGDGATGRA